MKRKFLLNLICLFAFVTFCNGQAARIEVTASKGDGIYSLLRKNSLDPVQFYKEFIQLNKDNLGPKNSLFIGRNYFLPPIINESLDALIGDKPIDSIANTTPKISDELNQVVIPIFGKEQSTITIIDDQLKGATYYLISGHGGPDPGAVAKYNNQNISEDEYAYDVTLRLARKLISHGANVHIMIKDADDGIRDERILKIDHDELSYTDKAIPRKQKSRLKQRTDDVNRLFKQQKGYRRLIVTHVDSRSISKNIDVFFYHHKLSKNGKRLAQNIQNTFKKKYEKYQPNRDYSGTVNSRGLYLVNNTFPAMVYIELGNIRNKKDQKRILDPDNRQAVAKWIAEGLILDFKQE